MSKKDLDQPVAEAANYLQRFSLEGVAETGLKLSKRRIRTALTKSRKGKLAAPKAVMTKVVNVDKESKASLQEPLLADVLREHPDHYPKEAFDAYYSKNLTHMTYGEALAFWLDGNRGQNDYRFAHAKEMLDSLRKMVVDGLVTKGQQDVADLLHYELAFKNRHTVSEDDERRAWAANREGGDDYEVRALKGDYAQDERLRQSIHKQLEVADGINNLTKTVLGGSIPYMHMHRLKALGSLAPEQLDRAQRSLAKLKHRDDVLESSRACIGMNFKPIHLDF